MKVRMRLKKLLLVCAASAVLIGSGLVVAAPAEAATSCKTVSLDNSWYPWSAVRPFVQMKVCYNGSHIWQGDVYIYKGVNTWVYALDGIDWVGAFNNGSTWLGVGLDYRISWAGVGHWTCNTRWYLDAYGRQTGYNRGC